MICVLFSVLASVLQISFGVWLVKDFINGEIKFRNFEQLYGFIMGLFCFYCICSFFKEPRLTCMGIGRDWGEVYSEEKLESLENPNNCWKANSYLMNIAEISICEEKAIFPLFNVFYCFFNHDHLNNREADFGWRPC